MFNPDLLITKASDDRLNRQMFAESLAHILLRSSFPTSFAVGLYGPWGSGKTSLLNMVIEQVESEDNAAIIVRFNPWLCSDPKQLMFFRLINELAEKEDITETIKAENRMLWIQRVNTVRETAMEIVNNDLIYA